MGAGYSGQPSDAHIVIVGGGYGGTSLAVKLLKTKLFKVTVIDGRDAMLHSIGALRTCVDEKYANKLFLPYDQMLGESFKRGRVVSLDTSANTLKLESGEEVSYTYLVIASGATQAFPATVPLNVTAEEGRQMLTDFRNEVKSAKNIVVVGGGAVGVEFSGEIKTEYPDKNVTLITSQDYLASSKGKPSFQKSLLSTLTDNKIEVVFKERVSNLDELTIAKYQEDQIVKTNGGKEFSADFVLKCTGTRFEDQFFTEALSGSLDEHGFIRVDEYMNVNGHDDVFALGDVTNTLEEKMAYTADLQANLIFKNFMAELKGGSKSKYRPATFLMVVPVGRNGGAGQLNGLVVGNLISRNLKSQDLFYQKMWKERGLKVPSA